jgi:PRC-barrel domain
MLHVRQFSPHKLQSSALGIAAAVAFAATSSLASAQAPAAGQSGPAPEPAALSGAALAHFPSDDVFRILGKDVLSATGENMGRIVDVLFDRSGKPCAAIIDFGGFLGVGTRKIAVDWSALRFDLGEKKNVIALDLGREQLKAAPEYKESDKPVGVVTLPQLGPNQAFSGSSQ